ncbi:MAG: hypothetical protein ACHQ50_04600 [Fimbriimonadales bacterium]
MKYADNYGSGASDNREQRWYRTASEFSRDKEGRDAVGQDSGLQTLEDDGWGSQTSARASRIAKYRAQSRGKFLRPLRLLRILTEILLLVGALLFLAVPLLTIVGLFLILAVGELFFTRLVLELMATSTLESHHK